jgi:hypothetical protein
MKDSIDKQDIVSRNDAKNTTGIRLKIIGKHDVLLPISIVGGLVGMLAGTLPAAIWALLFGFSFSPMYIFIPLIIYRVIKIFKGYTGKRGFAAICIFSVFGFYLTILSCQASADVLKYGMSFLNLPLVTATLIGKSEAFSGSAFSSAYIFPFLFSLLGVMLTRELLMHKNEPTAVPAPVIIAEAESNHIV